MNQEENQMSVSALPASNQTINVKLKKKKSLYWCHHALTWTVLTTLALWLLGSYLLLEEQWLLSASAPLFLLLLLSPAPALLLSLAPSSECRFPTTRFEVKLEGGLIIVEKRHKRRGGRSVMREEKDKEDEDQDCCLLEEIQEIAFVL